MNSRSVLSWLKKKRVAVLKGGWSKERPISLKTGKAVEDSFRRLGIKPISIDVNRSIATLLQSKKIEFGFVALHGEFGEDGAIQAILESFNIPYNGSGPLSSAMAMDKNISKKVFQQNDVPTAPWIVISKDEFNKNPAILGISRSQLFGGERPLFVKPVDQGSAIGISKVDRPSQLVRALKKCFQISDRAMIEKFIPGREFTVGILGKTALPVVEIIPVHAFYDFHSKYAKGGSRHLVPTTLSSTHTKKAQAIALRAFQSLGCSVYGRVDLIMNSQNQFFVLEVNTIPGMTPTSLLPDAARAAGMTFDELVLKIVGYSLMRKK